MGIPETKTERGDLSPSIARSSLPLLAPFGRLACWLCECRWGKKRPTAVDFLIARNTIPHSGAENIYCTWMNANTTKGGVKRLRYHMYLTVCLFAQYSSRIIAPEYSLQPHFHHPQHAMLQRGRCDQLSNPPQSVHSSTAGQKSSACPLASALHN